ncbi:MAG: hypothetical protein HKO06_06705, partial [Pseudomonadales bacterium]|nr:hypothetical protein [Pseudomonadales bacterium]
MFKNSWAVGQPNKVLLRAVLIAMLFSIAACEPSDERRVEMAAIHEKQAKAYLNSGQYRAAVIEAQNVIQKAPSQAAGYILLAQTLNELGQYRNSLNVLEQAFAGSAGTVDTSDSDFYLTKIEARLGRGKFATALQTLT